MVVDRADIDANPTGMYQWSRRDWRWSNRD
jgi:hypothetical protein